MCTREDLPSSGVGADCVEGFATLEDGSRYGCDGIDLYSFVNNHDLGVSRDPSTGRYWRLNDIWGWVDPVTGEEWAMVGAMDGTSFVDISNATTPVVVAWLPMHAGTEPRTWRDIKVGLCCCGGVMFCCCCSGVMFCCCCGGDVLLLFWGDVLLLLWGDVLLLLWGDVLLLGDVCCWVTFCCWVMFVVVG